MLEIREIMLRNISLSLSAPFSSTTQAVFPADTLVQYI